MTNLGTIRALCEKYGFSLSKGFGQNFLVNPGVCPKICDTAKVDKNTNVLEIGPGFGTLTAELAARAKQVVSVEIDQRLLPVLKETLEPYNNTKIVQGDVLKIDLAALLQQEFGGPAVLCANLPYYITSPVLMRLLEERLPLNSIVVMVQKEAAQRIAAKPGTRDCGAISYAVHYYADVKIAFDVQPGSFYPPPKVKSSVLNLRARKQVALQQWPKRQTHLFELIRASFGQRRKTLANSASAGLQIEKEKMLKALQTAQLAPTIRPEQLTLEEYVRLEDALWQLK
ncbi:MAG: 16S rRNA (adenine(1518)-N(6)/adenine(1519)-N(6))-dimethyltransferase RsmA [Oscillospiraceae bacterium]